MPEGGETEEQPSLQWCDCPRVGTGAFPWPCFCCCYGVFFLQIYFKFIFSIIFYPFYALYHLHPSMVLVSHLTTACPSITPRSAWEARETHCPQMSLPAKYVIIIHTAGTTCNTSVDCQTRVRDIQSYHMDRLDFCDIGYQ